MPIYEYECDRCGHEFEREQRITDDPIRVCPKCRGRRVRRLISRTSFVLKGGGWYRDLYSSPNPGKGKKQKKESSESGESKSESAETKAAPKAEKGSKTGAKGRKSEAA